MGNGEKLGTRAELTTEPQADDGMWINTGRTNPGTLPALWSQSQFISYQNLKSFIGSNLADNDLQQKATDDTRTYSVNGNTWLNALQFLTAASDVILQVRGDRVTEMYGSSGLVAQAATDTFAVKKIVAGGISNTAYALEVRSTLGSFSGIAAFKNTNNLAVFDFSQFAGSATLDMKSSAGATNIALNAYNGSAEIKMLIVRAVDTSTSTCILVEDSLGADLFKVLNSGNVGVGTPTNPTAKLEVFSGNTGDTLKVVNVNSSANAVIRAISQSATQAAELILENNAGNLLSITSNGSSATQFASRPAISYADDLAFDSGGTEVITITAAGDVQTHVNTKGFVVRDRSNGNNYRIYTNNGTISVEQA